jgi:integrase
MEHLTIKAKEVKSIHLTIDELDKIDNTYFKAVKNKEIKCTASELETAKDWLIISANCGARVSDYMRFTIDMINTKEGAENSSKKYIDFIQKKTEGKMSIPLNDKIIEILNKRGFNFPDRITDQRFNILLKEVCKQAKINTIVEGGLLIDNRKVYDKYPKYKLVSSHIGRRSFASNNYGKIPTSFLTYMTGHSSELQFRKYLGKTNDDIATEVAKYF